MNEIIKNDYKESNEYILLIDDCRSIISEGVFRSRQELIEMYETLGNRIINDSLYKKWGQNTQGRFMSELVDDVGKSRSTLYYATQYVEKLDNKEFSMTVEKLGKNISWSKIKALLPAPKENRIELPIPKGEYGLIVVDPPWKYETDFDVRDRRSASKYEELPQEELKKLKIPSAKDCVLWLWTTHKFLWDAKELLDLWGFEYKLTLVWNKEKMGMGAWLRCQSEFCLLGIKGKPKWELTNERDIITESRREHSRKPDGFYKMAEKLTPVKNKLDVFGREKREGWTIYGNEPEKF